MFRDVRGSLALATALLIGLSGCAEEVEGPAPSVPAGDTLAPTFDPGFVCNEQVESWITVSGEEFSPLVVDSLNDPSVDFPTVTLTRSATIEGDELTTETVYTKTLEASDIADESHVKWIDSNTLAFYIDPDLDLPRGSFDVTITNPNGESATAEGAFGVLPRPTVTGVIPDMACVAQGERSVEVQGDHFLVSDSETPTVSIGDKTYEIDEANDCRELLSSAFGTHQVCKSLTITVAEGDFEPGQQQVTVNNIEPAACSSKPEEDTAGFLVVAPPTVTDVNSEPICSEQNEYADMSVSGENFIRVTDADGNVAMPTVTVGDTAYTASDASGCEPIEGLVNQTAERCTELTFAIAADDHQAAIGDGERSAELDVVVENPQPAGCSSTEALSLTVVPPPSVTDAQPEPSCVAEESKTVTVTGFGFLNIDGTLPQVQIGPNTYDADALSDCTAVEQTDGDPTAESVESCDTLTVTLPTAAVDPDTNHAITVINPETAACSSTEDVQYYVAGPPTFTNITPQPICTADGDNTMLVEGENFLEITDDTNTAHWPTVTIGGNVYDAANIGNCTDAPLQDDGLQRPTRICTTLEVVIPQGDLAAGDHAVSVTNPLEANCSSTEGNLNIVPPPTVNGITEEIACVAQGEKSFVVDGADFLVIDGAQPSVQVAGKTYAATVDTSSCTNATVNGRSVDTCTSLSFTVPQDDIAPGVVQVSVVNPDSAACTSTNTADLTIHPAPTVAAIQPNPICSDAGGSVEVTGQDFIVFDGTTPTVTVDGVAHTATADTTNDCTQLTSVTANTVYNCSRLTLDIPASDISTGTHVVGVANPSPVGCNSTDSTSLVALAPPTVSGVTEAIACNETADTTLTIAGTGFAKTATGELPTVTIGGTSVQTTAANGCTVVTGTAIETCTELEVLASAGTLAEGAQAIEVTNPGGGGCASGSTTDVDVFGVAQVSAVNPSLYCDQQGGTELTIDGSNFFVVDGNAPQVQIGTATYTATVDTSTCTTATARVESCTSLTVTVPEADLTSGTYDASVINPGPLDCPSSSTAPVVEAGAPTITAAQPDLVCSNDTAFQGSGSVTLTGTNFLVIDSTNPTVTVNGVAAIVTGTANCTSVTNPTYAVESCTELTVEVPSSERDVDMLFELQNPAPADCGQPTSFTLPVEPAPIVTAVTPLRICRDGGSVQIDGQNFEQGMTVDIAGIDADTVTVTSSTSATATWTSGLPPGDRTLTVTNPSTCSSDFSQPITVVAGPQVFYVDPPVAYNGINTQVKVYLSGLEGGSISDVTITDSQGNATSVAINFDPNTPNVVQATIPAGILAQGSTSDVFDITVTDDVNCAGTGNDLLTVTDELTVAVDNIDPPFGWTSSSTGVTVTATDPAPQGQVQFAATPRVYINPVNAGPTTLATELSALQFVDATELNGIVPTGMPVGQYDVIVVNPDGTVGLLTDPNDPALGAFEITQDPPPLVDTVTPGSWPTGEAALPVTIEGDNFRDPTVEAFCNDGTTTTAAPITRVGFTTTTIDVTVDTNPLSHLSSCYIVVTNGNDGTYAEYSPVTVFNPAGNFVSFQAGPNLVTARRDPLMSSGQPSRRAKFIYAFGGDDGASANALTSMEASQLDRFGNPTAWWTMPKPYNLNVAQNELPVGLTHTEAVRVDDFIYAVGGYEGPNGATTKVIRANVLDPLDVPEITNLELGFGEGIVGNDPGTYYYRVSAVLDTSAAHNPGGETLASEPQPVSIPLNFLKVELTWASFPDAVEYRVYRTATPDQPVGTEELLATVPAPQNGGPVTYTDTGADTPTTGATPLPLGSLGAWHQPTDTAGNPLALDVARYHHGVTFAPDPDTPGQYFVYAAGGGDGTSVFGDYEYFAVTVNGPRDQAVSPVTQDATNVLSIARWKMPALAATPQNSLVTDSYVYVMGGDQGGTVTRRNEAALVNPDGSLGAWTQVDDNQRSRAEYGAAIANNAVAVAGGDAGSTNTTADSSEICNPAEGCTAPDLVGWNSLSQVNLRLRALPGYVSYNGFFYLTGGYDTGTGAVLDTTDYSVLGGTP
ncbi:hypothetical protein FIV42_20815 [Persicimonas caeni]|uniref:IPT/TIG domain-containing protein n=1 Tax=Persicimonas caeni TaxID=2292766 RepID=A0A4Y6PYL5_PERCE|nr:IPT/TIG domain-containing protein [Persicimonas caeni]QDG53097.1 hypothetical protein FIV42_20815 [Persicimonas caeni]QED34319.1 hypothetical protein FRD00_20810 [Persicimonas caeni]